MGLAVSWRTASPGLPPCRSEGQLMGRVVGLEVLARNPAFVTTQEVGADPEHREGPDPHDSAQLSALENGRDSRSALKRIAARITVFVLHCSPASQSFGDRDADIRGMSG